jgi:hypothetical protein
MSVVILLCCCILHLVSPDVFGWFKAVLNGPRYAGMRFTYAGVPYCTFVAVLNGPRDAVWDVALYLCVLILHYILDAGREDLSHLRLSSAEIDSNACLASSTGREYPPLLQRAN